MLKAVTHDDPIKLEPRRRPVRGQPTGRFDYHVYVVCRGMVGYESFPEFDQAAEAIGIMLGRYPAAKVEVRTREVLEYGD